MASFGHSSRSPPPAKPQPMAKGRAMISPLASGGSADQGADHRAGVRPGHESRHERPLEAQIGGLVVEQQSRADARRERDAEEQDEDEAIGPVAALEDQDVAEPAISRQHRRQRGDHGQLDDERGEQDLLEPEFRAWHDLH